MSRLRGHLPILSNKNPDVDYGKKEVKRENEEVHKFHFHLDIDLHSFFIPLLHF